MRNSFSVSTCGRKKKENRKGVLYNGIVAKIYLTFSTSRLVSLVSLSSTLSSKNRFCLYIQDILSKTRWFTKNPSQRKTKQTIQERKRKTKKSKLNGFYSLILVSIATRGAVSAGASFAHRASSDSSGSAVDFALSEMGWAFPGLGLVQFGAEK